MMQKNVITIGREFGSGGRHIGEEVAKQLAIPFYDKAIIELTAIKTGLSETYIQEVEQNATNSFYFNLAVSGIHAGTVLGYGNLIPPETDIFITQSNIIREIADKGPCVIVGRCADYILRDREEVLSIFIHSDLESRIKRATEKYGLEKEGVEDALRKRDKSRANHYSRYTSQIWGNAKNYHLTLHSDHLGIDKCIEMITGIVK